MVDSASAVEVVVHQLRKHGHSDNGTEDIQRDSPPKKKSSCGDDVRNKYFLVSSMKDLIENVASQNIVDFIKETHFYKQL